VAPRRASLALSRLRGANFLALVAATIRPLSMVSGIAFTHSWSASIPPISAMSGAITPGTLRQGLRPAPLRLARGGLQKCFACC
jgi:hypothetical protein